jgi:CHASE3 domain sensor protein
MPLFRALNRAAIVARSLMAITVILVYLSAYPFMYMRKESALAAKLWVDRTTRIIIALADLGTSVRDAERGQRGYLLTGDESYLEPYELALGEVPQQLMTVQDLLAGDPEQEHNLRHLVALLRMKRDELSRTVYLRKQGRAGEALDIVKQNAGAAYMRQIRATLDRMRNVEVGRFDRRQRQSLNAFKYIDYIILPLFICNALLSVLMLQAIYKEVRVYLDAREADVARGVVPPRGGGPWAQMH